MRRRRLTALAAIVVAASTLAACSGSRVSGPAVTVTQTTYAPATPSGAGSGTASSSASVGPPESSSTAGSSGSSPAAPSTAAPSPTGPSAPTTVAPTKVVSADSVTEPDGFVITKLKAGQKPPQFVAVSFDGAGWHEKWQYYFGIAEKVPFHFTANLTGLYLIDQAHKNYYHGSGHKPGATSLGSWNTPEEVKQEILDINDAYAGGDEIASHFMGHFCSDNPPGADTWSTAAWTSDLDQFFDVWKNYKTIDQLPGLPTLNVPASAVTGERTPCLEGSPEALFPALVAHHMTYDQSFTHRGMSWPTQSSKDKIWNMGMAEFPLHGIAPGQGANHFQITMDYNFWYSQEHDASSGQMKKVSSAQSHADAAQVTATYQDMLAGAMAGSHAPLLLGNHFNAWNNNAYTDALGNFLLANCGKTGVHCVPFRDVVDWMNFQDPKVMAALQAQPPVLGPPASRN